MKKIFYTVLLAVFTAAIIVISYWIAQQAYSWMPLQATAEAKSVDSLFSFLTGVGAFIFLGVVGMISYSIIAHRTPQEDFQDGPPIRGSLKLEILWTAIPTILVLWVAAQSFYIYNQLQIHNLPPLVQLPMPLDAGPAEAATVSQDTAPVQRIDVIARQWSWSFRYPGNVTSTELHLPVNQRVSLALQTEDVLHGFYIPEFRIKQDIIPNRTIYFMLTALREGKYLLRDSAFSGTYVALNAADVYIESPETYQQWLAKAATYQPTPASNRAFSEYHSEKPVKTVGFGWPTVPPAPPPVVNYPSDLTKEGQR